MCTQKIQKSENSYNYIIDILEINHFPDPYRFCYRNAIDNFMPIQNYPIDSMLTGDTQ